jgi:hypothetical protein
MLVVSLGVVCSEHPEFRTALEKQFLPEYDHKN